MKKVEIISMQQVDNYGSVLQAYSLKKIIESFDCQVIFTDIEVGHDAFMNLQSEAGDVVGKSTSAQRNRNIIRRIRTHIRGKISAIKLKKIFDEFRVENGLNNSAQAAQLDVCVIGSDEVFNCMQKTKWGFSTQLFGDVKNANKVITYAASCGFTTAEMLTDELKKEVKNAMDKLSAISVRDENTSKFVQELIGKTPTYNLDPVAVGEFTNELKYVDISSKLPARYCIIYAYSNRFHSIEEINSIKNYCTDHNLKIVSLYGEQEWVNLHDKLTPFELLKAFENAYCIITDTFHGTIFGAKFGKRMAIFIRESNQNKLGDLIKRLQIEDHVVSDISKLSDILNKNIDRKKILDVLKREKKLTLEYLKNNL